MSDLAAFLRARLDEDESHTGSNWIGTRLHELRFDVKEELSHAEEPGLEWLRQYGEGYEREIENIADAYWARVHREVEAKRRILELHKSRYGTGEDYCDNCDIAEPCDTVRALVAVYTDHPDYDPAWG